MMNFIEGGALRIDNGDFLHDKPEILISLHNSGTMCHILTCNTSLEDGT